MKPNLIEDLNLIKYPESYHSQAIAEKINEIIVRVNAIIKIYAYNKGDIK